MWRPDGVRYHLLAPMLLNELQKQARLIERQAQGLRRQEDELQRLIARLERLEAAEAIENRWASLRGAPPPP